VVLEDMVQASFCVSLEGSLHNTERQRDLTLLHGGVLASACRSDAHPCAIQLAEVLQGVPRWLAPAAALPGNGLEFIVCQR